MMVPTIAETMTIKSEAAALATVRHFIGGLAVDTFTAEPQVVPKIVMAVDEAVANVIEHAYAELNTVGEVHISVNADDKKFVVEVRDAGKPFNPLSVADVNLREHAKQGKRGGLGVFIIRKIMDEVTYEFVENRYNVLRMVKYLTVTK